jgi:hypothetical protein
VSEGGTKKVLVHLDPKAPDHVLGLWFSTLAGPPRPYYPEMAVAEAPVTDTVLDLAERLPWAEVVERLVDRLPYAARWEAIDVPADAPDADIYASAAAEFKASAEASPGSLYETEAGTFTWSMLTGRDAELAGTTTDGEKLAVLVRGPRTPFTPGRRLTTLLQFFADDDLLLVVAANPDAPQRDVDLALAYGLAWMGDRDLWLVLPEATAEATRERAVFIDWRPDHYLLGS